MNDNLPPSCSPRSIDKAFGPHEVDIFIDNYVDFHFDDLEMFNAFLCEGTEQYRHVDDSVSVVRMEPIGDAAFQFLREFADIVGAWTDWLEREGEKDYWEGRIPEDKEDR